LLAGKGASFGRESKEGFMENEHSKRQPAEESSSTLRKPVSRREFLRMAGIAGAGITLAGGLGGLMAACGEEEATTTTTAGAQTTTTAAQTTTTGAAQTTTTVKPAAKVLKVGCVMPFSGPYGGYGIAMKPGVQAYADLLNEGGGVAIGSDTYTVEMRFPDDAGDPKRTPQVAQELIDWGAVGNVGSFTQFGAFAELLTPQKMFHVGQIASSIDLKKCPYVIGAQCEWGPAMYLFELACRITNSTKMGIICYDWQKIQHDKIIEQLRNGQDGTNPDNPFFTKELEIAAYEVMTSGNQDFGAPLSKFKDAGVQLIGCSLGPGDYALLAKQAGNLGYEFNFETGGTATDLKEFIATGGQDNVQGMMCASPIPWMFKNSQVDQELQDMAKAITDKVQAGNGLPWNQQYLGIFEWGVNGLRILLDFMMQAGTTDADAVMEKVIGGTVHDFTGVCKMGGTRAWGDTARIKASNVMLTKVVGDTWDYAGDLSMPAEW